MQETPTQYLCATVADNFQRPKVRPRFARDRNGYCNCWIEMRPADTQRYCMYAYVYVCMYVRVRICVYVCPQSTSLFIYACVRVCVCVCVYLSTHTAVSCVRSGVNADDKSCCIRAQKCACVCECVYVCVSVCVHVCVCVSKLHSHICTQYICEYLHMCLHVCQYAKKSHLRMSC